MSLNDFDQKSQDKRSENKFIDDGIGTLCDVLNQKAVLSIPILIMLNKIDLFRTKVNGGSSIVETFPDYPGDPKDPEESVEFIKEAIKKIVKSRTKCKVVNMFVTCATDTVLMKTMISKMIGAIHEHNFHISGMGGD